MNWIPRQSIAVGLSVAVAATLTATIAVAAVPATSEAGQPRAFGSVLAAPTTAAVQQPALDPYLRPSGNRGIDVRKYNLKLTYGGKKVGIKRATVAIRARTTQALRTFSLDARRGLKIGDVRVNGRKATFRTTKRKLVVSRIGTLAADSQLRIRIAYHGKPRPVGDKSGRGANGWITTPGGVVTFNEPIGTSTWVPCNDVFYDKAKWRIDVTVPKGLLGVSVGRLVKKSTTRSGVRTVWNMNKPIQAYAQSLAIDRFNTRAGKIDGIRNFVAVAKGSNVTPKQMVQRTRKAIRWLTRRLGEYPYRDTGAIVVSGSHSAMETAGRPTYSDDPYYTSLDTVVHEQAHMWFGNALTATHAKDMWIHEGFATYLENVESAGRRGRSLDDIVHDQYVTDGWGKRFHNQFAAVSLDDPTPKYLLNSTVYFRGQAAVHALRHEVGETRFWQALRKVADVPHGRTTTTAELVADLERATGKDLSGWVQTWVSSKGYQQLPQNPSYRQVLRELGRPIMDAASNWAWRQKGSAAAAMKGVVKTHSPTNQLVINKVRTSGKGKAQRVYVDFETRSGPLYPRPYQSCYVFRTKSHATGLGSFAKLRITTDFADNTFTPQACPA